MRVVLDTNVLVSGMLGFTRDESVPGGLLRRWREDAYQLVISRHILTELNRSLNNNWIRERIAPETQTALMTRLRTTAELVEVERVLVDLPLNPPDQLVVAAAVAGNAEYLVSGDRAVLELGRYQRVSILNPRAFLTVLEMLT